VAGSIGTPPTPTSAALASPIRESRALGLRSLLYATVFNLLALPDYATRLGINSFVFFGLSGYLFAEENWPPGGFMGTPLKGLPRLAPSRLRADQVRHRLFP
jgi:hypothetical protein